VPSVIKIARKLGPLDRTDRHPTKEKIPFLVESETSLAQSIIYSQTCIVDHLAGIIGVCCWSCRMECRVKQWFQRPGQHGDEESRCPASEDFWNLVYSSGNIFTSRLNPFSYLSIKPIFLKIFQELAQFNCYYYFYPYRRWLYIYKNYTFTKKKSKYHYLVHQVLISDANFFCYCFAKHFVY